MTVDGGQGERETCRGQQSEREAEKTRDVDSLVAKIASKPSLGT